MKRTPTAHVIFPRPSAVRPVPEFAWEAARAITQTLDLDVDILLPIPMAPLRSLQGLYREAGGGSAWPRNLEDQLRKLEPSPTLIPYIPMPRRSIESASAAVAAYLLKRPRAGRPKVIQGSFLDEGGYVAAMAARVLGVPSLVVGHGSDVRVASAQNKNGDVQSWLRRKRRALSAIAKASKVLATSTHLAKALALVGVRADVLRFTSSAELFELGTVAPKEPPEILFVGRLSRAKGIDVLLEALAKLEREDVRLRVVGAPADVELSALSRRLNIEHRVRFEGEVPQGVLPKLYARSTCLALPAREATRANVVIESLLVGRPVVTSTVGALSEVVDVRVGRQVEPGNVDALVRGLSEVIDRSERGMYSPKRLRTFALPMSWAGTGPRLAEITRGMI